MPEIRFQSDACYRGCYQIRATDATNQLALIVARSLIIDEQSILFIALRSLIRAWRNHNYSEGDANETGLQRFLRRFDIAYRVRRLRFVLRELDSLYALQLDSPDHPARQAAVAIRRLALGMDQAEAESETRVAADLPTAWRVFAAQYARLHKIVQRLTEKPLPVDDDTPLAARFTPPPGDPVHAIRALLLPLRDQVITVLKQIGGVEALDGIETHPLTTRPLNRSADRSWISELACDREAERRLQEDVGLNTALADLDAQLGGIFGRAFKAAHDGIVRELPEPNQERHAGRIAARFYQGFDLFDCVQFPMSFGTNIGEPDQVDIIRVCPEDAPALVPEVEARRTKLKGLVAAHFGAFLDRNWRVSDLLWGRLDAAERIVTALLPLSNSAALRDRLIDEAQNAILREFDASDFFNDMVAARCSDPRAGADLTAPMPQQILQQIAGMPLAATRQAHQAFMNTWAKVVPARPNPETLLGTLARGSQIVGRMLDGIASKRGLPLSGAWLINAGRALWGVVEISIPRRIGELLGRYWQSLLLLISIILILAGLVSGQSSVATVGWTLFVAAILLFLARASLARFIKGGNVLRLLGTVSAVVAVVVFAAGGWQLYSWATAILDKLHHLGS